MITARDTTTQVIDVPVTNLGPGVIDALSIRSGPDPGGWIEAEIVAGATATPAVLRLTVRPALTQPVPGSGVAITLSGRSAFATTLPGNRQEVTLPIILHRRFP